MRTHNSTPPTTTTRRESSEVLVPSAVRSRLRLRSTMRERLTVQGICPRTPALSRPKPRLVMCLCLTTQSTPVNLIPAGSVNPTSSSVDIRRKDMDYPGTRTWTDIFSPLVTIIRSVSGTLTQHHRFVIPFLINLKKDHFLNLRCRKCRLFMGPS